MLSIYKITTNAALRPCCPMEAEETDQKYQEEPSIYAVPPQLVRGQGIMHNTQSKCLPDFALFSVLSNPSPGPHDGPG